MDAIKKKMLAMKLEKENAMDKADQLEQSLKEKEEQMQKKEEEMQELHKKLQQVQQDCDTAQDALLEVNTKLEATEKRATDGASGKCYYSSDSSSEVQHLSPATPQPPPSSRSYRAQRRLSEPAWQQQPSASTFPDYGRSTGSQQQMGGSGKRHRRKKTGGGGGPHSHSVGRDVCAGCGPSPAPTFPSRQTFVDRRGSADSFDNSYYPHSARPMMTHYPVPTRSKQEPRSYDYTSRQFQTHNRQKRPQRRSRGADSQNQSQHQEVVCVSQFSNRGNISSQRKHLSTGIPQIVGKRPDPEGSSYPPPPAPLKMNFTEGYYVTVEPINFDDDLLFSDYGSGSDSDGEYIKSRQHDKLLDGSVLNEAFTAANLNSGTILRLAIIGAEMQNIVKSSLKKVSVAL